MARRSRVHLRENSPNSPNDTMLMQIFKTLSLAQQQSLLGAVEVN
jgi:hypothetical protein